MTSKNFEELEIWQLARSLTGKIYKLTRDGPFARDFGLGNQIQRASVSVMSNIAEGYERGGNQEFIQFLPLPRAAAARCAANFMWPWIRVMSTRRRPRF